MNCRVIRIRVLRISRLSVSVRRRHAAGNLIKSAGILTEDTSLNTVMAVAPESHRISPWSDAFSGRHPSRFSLWNHRVYSNCESGNCQLQAMITSKKDYQGGWSSTLQDHRYITEPYTRSENVRSRNYQMLLSRQDSRRFWDQKHQEIEGCQRDAIRDDWGRERPQESHKPGIPIL